MNKSLLNIENISKIYQSQRVLQIDAISVEKGECIALIGDNGAGKTTLLKSIVDLIEIDEGYIHIKGKNVKKNEEWKNSTSIFLSSNLLIPYLNPEEYLYFVGEMKNIERQEIDAFIEEQRDFYKDELFNNQKKQIRYLSEGNKQKVGLMSVLLGSKDLILLDEPYASLDISSKKKLSEMISEINNRNKSSFIISSHNLDEVLEVATRIIILKKGKIIIDKPSNAINKKEIQLILGVN